MAAVRDHRNPERPKLHQALANTTFFQAVFMVFYQDRAGLSLATILWVQTYFTALRAILDVSFKPVLPAHGTPVLAGAPERFRAALQQVREGHVALP